MYNFYGDSVSQAAAAKVMAEEMRARGQRDAAQAQSQGAVGAARQNSEGLQNSSLYQQPGIFAKMLTDMYREYNNRPQTPATDSQGTGGAVSGLMAADANTAQALPGVLPFQKNKPTGFAGDPSTVLMDLWKQSLGRTDQFSTPLEKAQRRDEASDYNRRRIDDLYASGEDMSSLVYRRRRQEQEAYDRANAEYKQDWLAKNPPPDPNTPEGKAAILRYAKSQGIGGTPIPYGAALRDLTTPPELPMNRFAMPVY